MDFYRRLAQMRIQRLPLIQGHYEIVAGKNDILWPFSNYKRSLEFELPSKQSKSQCKNVKDSRSDVQDTPYIV